jgi:serine/threonine-protein kinase
MATVLLAEDERLGRQVAIKRLHAESPEDTARRFRREAKLGASLNHPNIVSVYDIATDEEGVLIVMEYVDGETLSDAIKRGPTEPSRAIEILRGLAGALDHAHEEGIVHRDVKPANVLLGSDRTTVKLADLGIATAMEGTRITMSGTVLGTAAYMAPEQLEGHKPGPPTDIYALAVVAFETLSGRRAYDGRSPIEIAHRKASDPPPSLADMWPAAPAAAGELLARAMGPDPAARPRTATEFVDELEAALEPVPKAEPKPMPPRTRPTAAMPERRPYSTSPRRRSRAIPVLALLVIAAVCVGALIAFSGGGGGGSPSKSKDEAKTAAKKKKESKTDGSSQAAAPAPAEPSESGSSYQVPAAEGSSASEGIDLNDKGKALIDQGNYRAAIPVLERALRAFPAGTTVQSDLNYAFTLFNLGHALNAGGRPEDAIPVLEERLKNPNQRDVVQPELDAAKSAAGQG